MLTETEIRVLFHGDGSGHVLSTNNNNYNKNNHNTNNTIYKFYPSCLSYSFWFFRRDILTTNVLEQGSNWLISSSMALYSGSNNYMQFLKIELWWSLTELTLRIDIIEGEFRVIQIGERMMTW